MSVTIALILGVISQVPAKNDPALTVRAVRPDVQLERVIDLFPGERVPDPASALAAWRRATKNASSPGKGAEAAIAALNPKMIPELKKLDGATLLLDFSKDSGATQWAFVVSEDDGVFTSFATAMALTDGASEPPLPGGATVDRLGPPGSALMARIDKGIILGGSRDGLARGMTWREERRKLEEWMKEKGLKDPYSTESGWAFFVSPKAFLRSSSLSMRRIGEALQGLGYEDISGLARMKGSVEQIGVHRHSRDPFPSLKIDPEWLGDLPQEASAAFSIAVDSRPVSVDHLFQVIDRVEKADPANAKLAPVRVRLNLLARAARLDLEADLWPRLLGVSGFALGEAGSPRAVALGLHAKDPASAAKWRGESLPRLAKALRLEPEKAAASPGTTPLGRIAGRDLIVMNDDDATAWVAWGEEALNAIKSVRSKERRSLRDSDGKRVESQGPARYAWIRPSRLGLAPAGSPLGEALAKTPILIWNGENRGDTASDTLLWGDLRPAVHRFLEVIPLDPLPTGGP